MGLRGWNFDTEVPPGATGKSLPTRVSQEHGRTTLTLWEGAGARINTRGILGFTQGRVSFRIEAWPRVPGAWGAVWTMADPWPQAGEFDLVEFGMPGADEFVQTVHDAHGAHRLAEVGRGYGVYALRRDGTNVHWSFDGAKIAEYPDPSPLSPHWLCVDLMPWAERPPDPRSIAHLSVSDVKVQALT